MIISEASQSLKTISKKISDTRGNACGMRFIIYMKLLSEQKSVVGWETLYIFKICKNNLIGPPHHICSSNLHIFCSKSVRGNVASGRDEFNNLISHLQCEFRIFCIAKVPGMQFLMLLLNHFILLTESQVNCVCKVWCVLIHFKNCLFSKEWLPRDFFGGDKK